MPRYRRPYAPGAMVFFTVCLADRRSALLVEQADCLRWAAGATLRRHPVSVLAWVTLPSVIHTVWHLPPADCAYAQRWGAIKSRFSRALAGSAARAACAPGRRGASGLWQDRFWEHHIRDAGDLAEHLRFCRDSPVAAGLVQRPGDWPLSSFARKRPEAPAAAQMTTLAG